MVNVNTTEQGAGGEACTAHLKDPSFAALKEGYA